MELKFKRAYEPAEPDDGLRILVERLWPRGVSKEKAQLDHWAKDVAPSPELRKWYGHDQDLWAEFRERYRRELDENREAVEDLAERLRDADVVTFVFGSKEEERNSARVLAEYLEEKGIVTG